MLDAAAWRLAWKSIWNNRERDNLDPFNTQMAKTRLEEAGTTLKSRIPEAYPWLLLPIQEQPLNPVEWQTRRVGSGDSLSGRAWAKLERDGQVVPQLMGTILQLKLNQFLWQDKPQLGVTQLADYFTQYLYLDRLATRKVLLDAIQDGVRHLAWNPETFGLRRSL